MEWLYKKPVAHRGLYNDEFPENSIGAFKNAVEHGYPIETDLHLMKDGKIALVHESHLKRVCGKNVKVESLTAEDLKNYKIKDTDYCIPTLDELFEIVDGKVGLVLELKSYNPFSHKLEKAVLKTLENYKGDYCYESFMATKVKFMKKRTHVKCGQLETWKLKILFFMGTLINCHISKPDFIAYNIDQADNKYFKKWNKKLPSFAWTIKDEETLEKAKLLNFNNICFDKIIPDFEPFED